MLEKLRLFTFACLLAIATIVAADVADDIGAGEPMETVLRNAVDGGATIWEAAVEAYRVAPARLDEIVIAAFTMLPVLPTGRACENLPRNACEVTILQRLVQEGANPDEVWDLAARARTSGAQALSEGAARGSKSNVSAF